MAPPDGSARCEVHRTTLHCRDGAVEVRGDAVEDLLGLELGGLTAVRGDGGGLHELEVVVVELDLDLEVVGVDEPELRGPNVLAVGRGDAVLDVLVGGHVDRARCGSERRCGRCVTDAGGGEGQYGDDDRGYEGLA